MEVESFSLPLLLLHISINDNSLLKNKEISEMLHGLRLVEEEIAEMSSILTVTVGDDKEGKEGEEEEEKL